MTDDADGDGPVCGFEETTTDQPCQFPVADPDDHCFMHEDDDGPPEGHGSGSPDRNQLANQGGAPEGNKNALTHGLNSVEDDPAGLLDWMQENDPDAYEWVERKFDRYLQMAPFGPESGMADHLLQIVLYERAAWEAHGIQIRGNLLVQRKEGSGGKTFERLDENPVNLPLDRIRRTTLRALKELGVLPGPEADRREAAAKQDLSAAVRRLAEQEDDSDVINVSPGE